MKHSESINELAAALSLAQGKMKPAKMNATNPFLKNRYADLGAVTEACRDVLADNGLAFVQMAFAPPLETFGPAVGVETMLMHKSGQWLSEQFVLPVGDEKGKSIMQVAGSAISYARRYSLASMLGIVADEDSDGNEKQLPTRRRDQAPVNRQPAPLPPVKAVPPGVDPETGEVINTAPTAPPAPVKVNGNGKTAIDETTRKKFHALGVKAYGDLWDEKRAELVASVTKNRTRSSLDLTASEMTKLITGIEAKLPDGTEPPSWDELPSMSA